MRIVSMNYGGHHWEKQNLVSKESRKGAFDEYTCSNCGIKGKSYTLGMIEVTERYKGKLAKCKGQQKSKQVKVKHCQAVGPQFANLKDGSIHTIIDPPHGYDNKRGEWVMGVGEPVMLLSDEYTYV